MNMPRITAAQLVAIAGAAIAVAVAFGVDISDDQKYALLAFVAAIAAVLIHQDKELRKNRAENADKIAAANAPKQVNVTVTPSPQLRSPATTRPKPKTARKDAPAG